MEGIELGPALMQVFAAGLVIIAVLLMVTMIRALKKRQEQLDRLEKKIEALDEELKKKS
ncbi:DUF4083 domain-containing protein [Alkalicoccus chagannorensis]|uniref:DUF4083 domain-containing protein n=1 Tax=Alkalicoccus chagannorensis TaxID=427072 RepID=UPI0014768709|nr:DUF4083 domain-containing protein [Alkalicoccus chagannorensis]